MLRSGERDFGHGKVISLAVAEQNKVTITQLFTLPCGDAWTYGKRFYQFPLGNYEHILRYAFEGGAAFPGAARPLRWAGESHRRRSRRLHHATAFRRA